MARFNRRQIITGVSAIYLLLLSILAGWALHYSNSLSIPIPNVLAASVVALPILTGIAVEGAITFQSNLAAKGKLQSSKTFQSVNALFLVYEAVVATLAGTHLAPVGGLWCPLHDRWSEMFRAKDGGHIQAIQDAFSCCGFQSPKDMAFPFPDNNGHSSDACVVRYERDQACLQPWRTAERRVAIILLVVPVLVFAWKAGLFVVSGYDTSWLPSAIRLPIENGQSEGRQPRPAIAYRDLGESGESDSLRDEVNRLNNDSNLASHVEAGRVHPSPLIQEYENGWVRE